MHLPYGLRNVRLHGWRDRSRSIRVQLFVLTLTAGKAAVTIEAVAENECENEHSACGKNTNGLLLSAPGGRRRESALLCKLSFEGRRVKWLN